MVICHVFLSLKKLRTICLNKLGKFFLTTRKSDIRKLGEIRGGGDVLIYMKWRDTRSVNVG